MRERDLPGPDRAALVADLSGVLHGAGGHLLVAWPLPDPALAEIVDGVHLPASAPPLPAHPHDRVRPGPRSGPNGTRSGGTDDGGAPGWIVGRSCHDRDEVAAAVAEGVDHVTLSPYALTISKPGHGPALGVAGLRRVLGPLDLGRTQVYALGGLTPANAAEALAAGAHGVAVMGDLMRAEDPAPTTRRLLAAMS